MPDGTQKPIYVIGHKNPDTDAICSAITYAHYKNSVEATCAYVPARCGNSNARVDAIFKHFQVPLPIFLGDVSIRALDIMRKNPHKLETRHSCAEALRLIDQRDIRALPITDENNTLKGILSVFQLGEFFTSLPTEEHPIPRVYASTQGICDTLKGEALYLKDPTSPRLLRVRIAAENKESFRDFMRGDTAAEDTVVIVGNRHDIQKLSVELQVGLLVITGNSRPEKAVFEAAKKRGTSVIVSPYDTAISTTILRTATCLERLMNTEPSTFHAHESLQAIRRKISKSYTPLSCVVNKAGKLLGVFSRGDLFVPPKKDIILVDHNELSQAVDGAQEANILEIIDHHRLGNPPTTHPIHMRNEVIGSTCSIVAELFRQDHVDLDKKTAGLLMAGIISDTLNLQSPTTTERDKLILNWLSEKSKVDTQELVELIFYSGSIILSTPLNKLISMDCKHYKQQDISYSASQLEELGFSNFYLHEEGIFKALKAYRKQHQLTFSAILITDINHQNSLLLIDGSDEVLDNISYQRANHRNLFELPNVVSRKKQLIPYLTNLLNELR